MPLGEPLCINEFNGSVSATEGTLDFGQPPIKNTSPCASLKNNSSILIPSHFVVVTADQNTTKAYQRMMYSMNLRELSNINRKGKAVVG